MRCLAHLVLAAAASAVAALDLVHDVLGTPQYSLEFMPDTVNASDALALLDPAATHRLPGMEYSLLRATAAQAYLCAYPNETTRAAAPPPVNATALAAARDAAVALLDMYRNLCVLRTVQWFTYSLCFGARIQQFHAFNSFLLDDGLYARSKVPRKDPRTASFVLGTWSNATAHNSTRLRSAHGRADGSIRVGDRMFLEQTWPDGTLCDMTGLPRVTRVEFHCSRTADQIELITETLTCEYTIRLGLTSLCAIPEFAGSPTQPRDPIQCSLIAPDGAAAKEAYLARIYADYRKSVAEHADEPLVQEYARIEEQHIDTVLDALEVWFGVLGLEASLKTNTMRMYIAEVLDTAALGDAVPVPAEYTGDPNAFDAIIDSIVLIAQDPKLFARKMREDRSHAPQSDTADTHNHAAFLDAMRTIARNVDDL